MIDRRRLIVPLLSLTAGLVLTACGDDGESTEPAPAATADTATTSTTAASGGEMTAGEWMAASIPDQQSTVEELVADNPDECGDVDPKPGGDFQVAFAIDAAQTAPETPLSEIIVESCAEAGKGTS